MSDLLKTLIAALREADGDRERSQQTAVGWSEVAGCRAYLGFRLNGEWESDDTDPWRAIVGTVLHEYVGGLWVNLGPTGPTRQAEVETLYGGIPGHADLVDDDSVTDMKFPKLSVSESWRHDAKALAQKMVQVQGYAAGLVAAGKLDPDKAVVRLLVAPVDGTFDDWWMHEEPYDERKADEAVHRLQEVQSLLDQGLHPTRDMPYDWCERFCEFFSVCRNEIVGTDEPITDPELAAQVRLYGELGEQISPLTKLRKSISADIKGLRGVADGWKVGLTKPSGMKEVMDVAAVEADYAASGRPVPTKLVPTSAPSLRVDRLRETKDPA